MKKMKVDIEKRFKKIDKVSRKIHGHFETEDIHVFRVETKKLRAILRLIGTDRVKGRKPGLPKHLKDLYRILGAIRSLQLQQQNIRSAVKEDVGAVCETYLNLLNAKEAGKMVKAECSLTKKKALRKDRRQISAVIPAKVSKSRINKFITSIGSSLQKLVNEEIPSDESLHVLRKLLKDLLYCWPYIKADIALVYPAFPSKIEDIQNIVDLLGDFQDMFIGIMLLESDYINIDNEGERKLLLNIRAKWQQKKDDIKKQIKKELPRNKLGLLISYL